MQNEIVILKVSKFKTVALVGVTYRKADGTTGVSHGKTEAEAIAISFCMDKLWGKTR